MGMRVTTGMMMNTYRFNLQGSTSNLSDARNKVLTHRNFDSYAEDPAAATMAWRMRRAMYSNSDYQVNNDDTYSRFSIAWTTMGAVNDDLSDKIGRFSTIRGENGAIGAGRQPLGEVLDATAETIVQSMNSAKYGDHFVFAGNDEMNAPFSWSSDMKTLYYRGINVNAGAVTDPAKEPAWFQAAVAGDQTKVPSSGEDDAEQAWIDYANAQFDGDTSVPRPSEPPADWGDPDKYGVPENMPDPPETAYDKAWVAYYKDQGDLAKLDELSKEQQNVDLGMGLQEEADGTLINGTSFNRSLPGINMLGGYGVDEDGDPKNVVLIMKRIGELFSSSDPDSGEWAHEGDEEEAMRLLDKINAAHDRTTEAYDEVDTRSHFLKENQSRLVTQGDYLQEERLNIEQVDLADAITEFSWDYYCYSAALKVGTQLLSQTLLDYMG